MRIIIDNANEKQYRLHIGVSDSAGTQYSTNLWWGGELSHQANHGCFAPLRGAFFYPAQQRPLQQQPLMQTMATRLALRRKVTAGQRSRTAAGQKHGGKNTGTKTEWQKQMGTADKKEDCLILARGLSNLLSVSRGLLLLL